MSTSFWKSKSPKPKGLGLIFLCLQLRHDLVNVVLKHTKLEINFASHCWFLVFGFTGRAENQLLLLDYMGIYSVTFYSFSGFPRYARNGQ